MRIFNNSIKGIEIVRQDTPEFEPKIIRINDKNNIENKILNEFEDLSNNANIIKGRRKLSITNDRKSSDIFKTLKKHNSNESNIETQATKAIQKRKKTLNFGLCYVIRNLFRMKNKNNIYDFLRRYVNERLDVTFYLKTLEKFDRVRVLLFNYYQNMSLDFTKIPNLSNQDELNNIDMDIKNDKISSEDLVDYFNHRIKTSEMDDYDEQLLKIVTQEIQTKVMSPD